MSYAENSEIFKAALAVAGIDGHFSRAEMGLLNALAERVGVGAASLKAMIESATKDPDVKARLFARTLREPVKALELLVAAARIDGRISEDERQLLVHVAETLRIPTEACVKAFERGMTTADKLRTDRQKG